MINTLTEQISPDFKPNVQLNSKLIEPKVVDGRRNLTSKSKVINIEDDTESESEEYKQLIRKNKHKQKKSQNKQLDGSRNMLHQPNFSTDQRKKKKKKVYMKRKKDNKHKSEVPLSNKNHGLPAEFTFKPKILKTSVKKPLKNNDFSISSQKMTYHSETRIKQNKTPISHKLSKELDELRECSFTPNLKQTSRLNQSLEVSKSPRFETLHQLHGQKLKRFEGKSEVYKDMELQECTFIPQTNHNTVSLSSYKRNCIKEREKVSSRSKRVAKIQYATPNRSGKIVIIFNNPNQINFSLRLAML